MNENERTNLKIPFHFINFFRDKYLLSQKIKSQNRKAQSFGWRMEFIDKTV